MSLRATGEVVRRSRTHAFRGLSALMPVPMVATKRPTVTDNVCSYLNQIVAFLKQERSKGVRGVTDQLERRQTDYRKFRGSNPEEGKPEA